MKLFTTLFLLLTCSLFAVAKDTVVINTIKSEIDTITITDTIRFTDTVLIIKKMDFTVGAVTDSSITINMFEKKIKKVEKKKEVKKKKVKK